MGRQAMDSEAAPLFRSTLALAMIPEACRDRTRSAFAEDVSPASSMTAGVLARVWQSSASRLVVSALFAVVLAGLAPAVAEAADAKVIAAAGQAVVVSRMQGTERPLAAGSELAEGDTVRTGPDGRLQIRFSDGGLVSLQPSTTFAIEEYRYGNGGQRSFFSLLRGAVRSATGAIGKTNRDDWRLQTPTATVGIRGTEFLAEQTVCDPVCSPGPSAGLRVTVNDGRIAVVTAAGLLEVGAGQSAIVDSPGAIPQLTRSAPVLAPQSASARPAAAGSASQSNGAASSAGVGSSATGTTTATNGDSTPVSTVAGAATLAPVNADAISANNVRSSSGAIEAVQAARATRRGNGNNDLPGPLTPDTTLARLPAGDYSVSQLQAIAPALPAPADAGRQVVSGFGLQQLGTGADPNLPTVNYFTQCGSAGCARLDFAGQVMEAAAEGPLAWGRWTNGVIRVSGEAAGAYSTSDGELRRSANQGTHYLVGAPATTIPTAGAFAYGLIGATRPTIGDGSLLPGQFAGRAGVAFQPGSATVGLDGRVTVGNWNVDFATNGGAANPAASALRIDTTRGTTFAGVLDGRGSGCSPNCPVSVEGGLHGAGASHLGVGYTIDQFRHDNRVTGVGAFRQGQPIAP